MDILYVIRTDSHYDTKREQALVPTLVIFDVYMAYYQIRAERLVRNLTAPLRNYFWMLLGF